MRKSDTKTHERERRRPTLWERQGNRPTFDIFPALLLCTMNFIETK